MATVEERLQRLEDERSILSTLYTYGHAVDYGYEDQWVDCWTEDAVLHWPTRPGPLEGREAIRDAFRAHTHAPDKFHKHFLVEPRIKVDGDRATAESYYARLDQYEDGPKVRSFGRYRDVLVRCDDGRWRFKERRAENESRLPGSY